MKKNKRGFTLVELLIVIAVIAILAAIAFVAIDPATRFAESRNSQRWSDVSSILEGIQQYIVDQTGTFPSGMAASTTYVIGTGGGENCSCTVNAEATCLDMSGDLTPRYFSTIPMDPSNGAAADTDYYVARDANNHVTIGACAPEEVRNETPTINVTR